MADASKPWEGATNPRSPLDDTQVLSAVFVPITSSSQLGLRVLDEDLLRKSEQLLLVAPGATFTPDLTTFDEIIDGTIAWRIIFIEKLKPATITLIYYFGVAR